METIRKKRLYTDYEPLSMAVSLEVSTPHSSVGQVYDPIENSFAPDREITPLVITPIVRANTLEDSWSQIFANPLLAEMKWFVNGAEISTLQDWNQKYSINQEGLKKGAITIEYNIAVEKHIELHFEAVVPDERTGTNVPIISAPINLTTVDKAGDTWGVSIDVEPDIIYNPFLDKLLMYDYKVANGISAGSRADAIDSNAYEKTINLLVTRGGVKVTAGYTAHFYKLNGQTMTEITNDIEVIAKTNSSIKLDLRFIEKEDYMIIVKSEDKEVARTQFSATRSYPKYGVEILSGVSIRPNQYVHRNKVAVKHNSQIVEIPEPLIRMIWFTDTDNLIGKQWQEGNRCFIDILKTGIGKTYLDSWMDLYIKTAHKKAFHQYEDFTDTNGNIYIGN